MTKAGQVYIARGKRARFLDVMPEGGLNVSETTAELIDSEIKTIINTRYQVALQILNSRKNILRKDAERLLEKEKIEGSELKALLNGDF